MRTVSIKEARGQFAELARRVELGETIVITRYGKPIIEMVPHRRRRGLRLQAVAEFKRKHRIAKIVTYIADDFDAPLDDSLWCNPFPT